MIRPATVAEFSAIAREQLPEADAEYVILLLRPAIRLRHAEDGEAAVGYLAGDPVLPREMPWPVASFGSPLTHLMTLDLAALPDVGLGLPASGLLQFFCFADEGTEGVVHFVPSDVDAVERPSPKGIRRFDAVALAAGIETTVPYYDHAYLQPLVRDYDVYEVDEDGDEYEVEHPLQSTAWRKAIGTKIPSHYHLVGGYGVDVQGPADFAPSAAPAMVRTANGLEPDTELPVLLAQIDGDDRAGIGWGDMGISHWSLPREDLAARRFDRVKLTWSCF